MELRLAKKVMLFVEGQSEVELFSGKSFRDYFQNLGYSITTKNLKGKGNILVNFNKFLRVKQEDYKFYILLYDRDNDLKKNLKKPEDPEKIFFQEAVQELEAWYLADHKEIVKISPSHKLIPDTQSVSFPKKVVIDLFQKSGKGFKTEIGLAEHFKDRLNLSTARKNNKSLEDFLNLFLI